MLGDMWYISALCSVITRVFLLREPTKYLQTGMVVCDN